MALAAQPAYKLYAFDRGWRIIRYVTENLFKRTDVAARWWFNKGKDTLSWGRAKGSFALYWAYVVLVGMWLAGIVQYITAMIMAALFVAVQSVLLTLWAALCLLAVARTAIKRWIFRPSSAPRARPSIRACGPVSMAC